MFEPALSEMPLRGNLQAELGLQQLRCEPLLPRTTAADGIDKG
jgi:hypothetical protein